MLWNQYIADGAVTICQVSDPATYLCCSPIRDGEFSSINDGNMFVFRQFNERFTNKPKKFKLVPPIEAQ